MEVTRFRPRRRAGLSLPWQFLDLYNGCQRDMASLIRRALQTWGNPDLIVNSVSASHSISCLSPPTAIIHPAPHRVLLYYEVAAILTGLWPATRFYQVFVVCSALNPNSKNEAFAPSTSVKLTISRSRNSSPHSPQKSSINARRWCNRSRERGPSTMALRWRIQDHQHRRNLGLFLPVQGIPREPVDFYDTVPPTIQSTIDHSYKTLTSIIAKRLRKCRVPCLSLPVSFRPVGCGYSDFCASMISVRLRAEELQVWKTSKASSRPISARCPAPGCSQSLVSSE
ncbi:hypothetical protein F4803DRAFT_328861 [Xylaria telfairii]|nr:hypothetical protein F4803DRAFT_328861 [Xylaria telfairii]